MSEQDAEDLAIYRAWQKLNAESDTGVPAANFGSMHVDAITRGREIAKEVDSK